MCLMIMSKKRIHRSKGLNGKIFHIRQSKGVNKLLKQSYLRIAQQNEFFKIKGYLKTI